MENSVILTDKLSLAAYYQSGNTLITINSPKQLDGISRTPIDICCVIDVSGSMDTEALIHTEVNKSEGFGFSTLDLVKHALATIIESLGEEDRLALVTFSDEAKTILNLTQMDEKGKEQASKACKELKTEDSTNLWAGLEAGLNVLKSNSRVNSSIILLTDGQPNVKPTGGHEKCLLEYKAKYGLPSQINYFGFGYSMNSKLLNELAIIGDGAYSYIPDGSFVGTVFVNALANMLTAVASKLTLKISLENCKIEKAGALNCFNHKMESDHVKIDVGTVCFGQNRDIILPIVYDGEKKLKVEMYYESMFSKNANLTTQDIIVEDTKGPIVEKQRCRFETIQVILEASLLASNNDLNKGYDLVDNLIRRLSDNTLVKDEKFIVDIIYDLKEQVILGLSKKGFYTKWGSHYYYSLVRAHILQQRNNFKDPGVQNYGGEVFENLRDKIEESFLTIPPPEPSKKKIVNGIVAAPIQNMNVFYNYSGGCFSGDSEALMADGKLKFIRDVKQGDIILGPDDKPAKILCVVKTIIPSKRLIMCKLDGGLKLTPWHPVRVNGKWQFPENISPGYEMDCPEFYSFLLDNVHIMRINGVECVTLAHGFKGEVIEHAYLGSGAVVEDLKKLPGFEEGRVEIYPNYMQRDPKSNLIIGIRNPSDLYY